MAVSLSQHMREALIDAINTLNNALSVLSNLLVPSTDTSRWFGAGYLTGSQKQVRFTIPLNQIIWPSTSIQLTGGDIGIRAPAGGTTQLTNSQYTLTAIDVATCGIRIVLTTNSALSSIPNNSPVGIDFAFTIKYTKPI